jgi:hypothetical protein
MESICSFDSEDILSCVANVDPRNKECGMTVAPRIPIAELHNLRQDNKSEDIVNTYKCRRHPIEIYTLKAQIPGKLPANRRAIWR